MLSDLAIVAIENIASIHTDAKRNVEEKHFVKGAKRLTQLQRKFDTYLLAILYFV